MRVRSSGLRVPLHRGTTAQICATYPFQAQVSHGARGIFIGHNLLSGGDSFCFDPFALYTDKVITSPNMLVLGEVGSGKSSFVKTLMYRSLGVLGSPGGGSRWAAIIDPKGEYGPLAEQLGLSVIRLSPGGQHRLNPLDATSSPDRLDLDRLVGQRHSLVAALVAQILHRDLQPLEDAALGWALRELTARRNPGAPAATLEDLAVLMAQPSDAMVRESGHDRDALTHRVEGIRHAIGRMLTRDLAGMFDGQSTVTVDWDGPGVVIDLQSVHQDPDVLAMVMIATTGWLQAIMTAPPQGANLPLRYQVFEEVWALLSNERVARYYQSAQKLSRSYGVANIAVAHRIADLRAQADDGKAAAKIAMGILADTQTRVLFRQSVDQIPEATSLLGLSATEASLLPRLGQGQAVWKINGTTAVVQGQIADGIEWGICDTDGRLRTN